MLVLSKYSSHVQYFSVVIGGSVVGSCLVVGALVVGAADVGTAVVGAADVGASEVGASVVPSLMQSSNNGVRGPPQVLQSLSGSVRRLHCFAELLNTQYLQPIASNWSQSSSHSSGSTVFLEEKITDVFLVNFEAFINLFVKRSSKDLAILSVIFCQKSTIVTVKSEKLAVGQGIAIELTVLDFGEEIFYQNNIFPC